MSRKKSWTIKADYLLLYIVNKYNQTIINVIIFLTHNFNSITYEMSAVVMIKTGFWAFAAICIIFLLLRVRLSPAATD